MSPAVKPPQNKPTTDTIPLMNVLEILADSIAKELSVDSTSDNEAKDSTSDEDEINQELEDAIENLVTESLNKVFGISRDKEEQLSEQSDLDYPKGPKSKASSQQSLQSEHGAVTPSKEQSTTKSAKEESGFAKKVIIKKISLDGKQSQNEKSSIEGDRKGKKEEPGSHGTTKEQHKHSIAYCETPIIVYTELFYNPFFSNSYW